MSLKINISEDSEYNTIDMAGMAITIRNIIADTPLGKKLIDKKLLIGGYVFSMNNATEIDGVGYLLHHFDDSENPLIVYLLPVYQNL